MNAAQVNDRMYFWSRILTTAIALTLGLAAVVLALSLLARAGPARAATLCVKPGGGDGCQDTIQAAIDLALTGDTIQVAAGEYTEYVLITKTLTLQGGWAPDFSVRDLSQYTSTIKPPINMVNPDSVVWIQGQSVDTSLVAPTLDGFVLTGGRADLGSNHGGGLKIQDSDALVISNTITGNSAFLLGGGVWVQRGAPTLQGNVIEGNTSLGLGQEAYGGGVQLENTKASLVENIIASNVVSGTESYGGAVHMVGGTGIILLGNTVLSNTALVQGRGGGLAVQSTGLTITGGLIQDNAASSLGGGIWVSDEVGEVTLTMQGGLVTENRADVGGGLYNRAEVTQATVILDQTAFISNTATSSVALLDADIDFGGAPLAGGLVNSGANAGTAALHLMDSEVRGNTAFDIGGIMNFGSDGGTAVLTVSGSVISGNIAIGGIAGGILNSQAFNGQAQAVISNTTIQLNEAGDQGAGLYNTAVMTLLTSMVDGNISADNGGGIWNSGLFTMTSSSLTNNQATANGGGLFNMANGSFWSIASAIEGNMADSDNNAMGDGGGIYNNGSVDIVASSLSSNQAASFGGGIFNDDVFTATNALIHDNQADDGAGILAEGGSTTAILSSTVSGNTTIMGGGAGINNNGALIVQASTFSGNQTTSMNGNGAGILNNDQATILNSTVSGNVSLGFGGGIRNAASITLTNVTVFNNTGALGAGGVQNMDTALATNTIIAANSPDNCSDPLNTLGHNLEDADTCALNPGLNDLIGLNPLLGPLADNGGVAESLTHALNSMSPAIDAGDNAACPAADQRGGSRPVDGDGNGSAICDIGSYEYGSIVPWLYLPLVRR